MLDGILAGMREGKVDITLPEAEKDKIKLFILKMNSFSPCLFALYKANGETLLTPLFEFSRRVAYDQVSREDIEQFTQEYNKQGFNGIEVLADIIQRWRAHTHAIGPAAPHSAAVVEIASSRPSVGTRNDAEGKNYFACNFLL